MHERTALIRVAAAIIINGTGHLLVVRKRNTRFFMQPGGKIRVQETPSSALRRELLEELSCQLECATLIGTFSAPAANEPSHIVEAVLFHAEVSGPLKPSSEIEELLWLLPSEAHARPLAPLTRDYVIPSVISRLTAGSSGKV